MAIDIPKMTDDQKVKLVNNRYASSASIWDIVRDTYEMNTRIYENKGTWVDRIPVKIRKILANRIFPNVEAVINSIIANPPSPNVIPGRSGKESQELSRKIERFMSKKYKDRNVKEVLRMALRNLYFGRLLVIKVFWNAKIDDFDVKAIDPRKIRCAKYARKEPESEFFIEEVTDNLCSLIARFPQKKEDILKKNGFLNADNEDEAYISNPEVTYMEAWIGDYVIFKYDNIVLDTIRNPYWDWDGMMMNEEDYEMMNKSEEEGGYTIEQRREKMMEIKMNNFSKSKEVDDSSDAEGAEDDIDASEGHTEDLPKKSYYYNYFDQPRKPYIISTILNNENSPIGRTDFITLAAPLQEAIDSRKQAIDENSILSNGIVKVDSDVMDKSDAQMLAFEARGIIWGKGVVNGVQREVGQGLPEMVYNDMIDSRQEIDNIMAASSAFRGEREGQETKAGRLALIQQSFLRLNELVQVVDYVSGEMFAWFFQLAKTRYTEYHFAKWMGKDESMESIGLIQDDFEEGVDVVIVPGKTLPVDAEFRYERAQNDVANGILSPVDYMEEAGYANPKELAQNMVLYKQNPAEAVGLNMGEMPVPFEPGGLTPDQVAQTEQPQIPGQPQVEMPEMM